MPDVTVHIARVDIGKCSGMVFSFDPIEKVEGVGDGTPFLVSPRGQITVRTPPGYELMAVQNASPYGDHSTYEQERMVLDRDETERSTSGRVFMRAARLIERMRSGDERFQQVDTVNS